MTVEHESLPVHIGFIMDGNGRWATRRGLPRKEGHKAGADSLERLCGALYDRGIRFATFYGFSTENWSRPIDEVTAIMKIVSAFLDKLIFDFENPSKPFHDKTNIHFIGDTSVFSPSIRSKMKRIEEKSATFKGEMTLNIALNYGGRAEIARAASLFAKKHPGKPMTEKDLNDCLYTADQPDPDLIVRTAGEMRLSNFLIWQAAYAEYYTTDTCWPDFDEAELDKALADYTRRTRKFGGVAQEPAVR